MNQLEGKISRTALAGDHLNGPGHLFRRLFLHFMVCSGTRNLYFEEKSVSSMRLWWVHWLGIIRRDSWPTLVVCVPQVMINRDSWVHSYLIVRGEILGFCQRRTSAKAFVKDVSIDEERKLGDRRRSDTVVVLTINHADYRLEVVSFMTPSAPCEKSKFWGSCESMVARLKLKGIDGRAPPGVEFAA